MSIVQIVSEIRYLLQRIYSAASWAPQCVGFCRILGEAKMQGIAAPPPPAPDQTSWQIDIRWNSAGDVGGVTVNNNMAPPQQVPPVPAPPAAGPNLGLWQKICRYFEVNLAAILPAAMAAVVFVVARFILILPTDCAATPVVLGVPANSGLAPGTSVFCGPDDFVAAAFDASWRRLDAIKVPFVEDPPDPTRTGNLIAGQTGAFKEAKARVLWFGSFGTKIAVSIAAIVGLLWLFIVQIEDYCFDQNGTLQGWSISGLAALVVSTVLGVVVIYVGLYYGLHIFMFSGMRAPALVGGWFNAFHDAVLSFVADKLVPGGHQLIDFSDALVTMSTAFIALAVTVTLYQHPTQALRRATTDNDLPYEQFLIRCFQRLAVCMYAGATLLVVCIGEIGARYSWPASLIGQSGATPSTNFDQAYKNLSESFGQLASQFQLSYGLIFTLFLAALFLPAWIVLRRRAWQLVRTTEIPRIPNPSPVDQEKWLTDHKMAFSTYQQLGQLVAMTCPLKSGPDLMIGLAVFEEARDGEAATHGGADYRQAS